MKKLHIFLITTHTYDSCRNAPVRNTRLCSKTEPKGACFTREAGANEEIVFAKNTSAE